MRRPDVVVLDAFQLQRFKHARLSLHLFFQQLNELVLAGHDLVQLLDLMFEMRDVRLDALESFGNFIVHAGEGSQFLPATPTTSILAGSPTRSKRSGQIQSRLRNGNRLKRHRLVVIQKMFADAKKIRRVTRSEEHTSELQSRT